MKLNIPQAILVTLSLFALAFFVPKYLQQISLSTADAGFNDIVINARGTNGEEKIALFINDSPVQFWSLSRSFADYTYTPPRAITVDTLSIEFLNDRWEPQNGINYDVQIPFITVNGTVYNSEHSTTVSTGSWDQENWCAPGNKETQWLHCAGSFTYNVPGGTVVGIDTAEPACGNNQQETGEQCDDGNTASGDGCSHTCTIEEDPVLQDLPRGIISTSGVRLPIREEILGHADVTGFMILDGWDQMEPSEGVYDWSHIDSEVARAKSAGKVVRLAIHAGGDDTPQWVFDNYPAIKKVIWYDKRSGEEILIPAYWDGAFIDLKNTLYQAMGNRYKDEDVIFSISASMVDPNTGDWTFAADTPEQIQSYYDAGFTESVFIAAHKKVIDNAMVAFVGKYITTAIGPMPTELVSDRYESVDATLDYAYAQYGNRLIVAKGSLSAGTPDSDNVPQWHHWNSMKKYSPNAAGQYVWGVTNDPEYKMNGKVSYEESEKEAIFWNTALIGKTYDLRWVEPWAIDIVNPLLQDELHDTAVLFGE